MCNGRKKYRRSFRILNLLALLFFCSKVYPQNQPANDSIKAISAGSGIYFRNNNSFFPDDSLSKLPSSLIPATALKKDKNHIFYDSLKVRASGVFYQEAL